MNEIILNDINEYFDLNYREECRTEQVDIPFSAVFFRLYDRKVSSGEITFSKTGIKKSHFTIMCTDSTFIPEREAVREMCVSLKLSFDEAAVLLSAAGYDFDFSIKHDLLVKYFIDHSISDLSFYRDAVSSISE